MRGAVLLASWSCTSEFEPPLPIAQREEDVKTARVRDAATLERAAQTLISSGVVACDEAMSSEQTEALRKAATINFEEVRRQLLVVEAMGAAETMDSLALGGFHELVARDGGRYDMRYKMEEHPLPFGRALL